MKFLWLWPQNGLRHFSTLVKSVYAKFIEASIWTKNDYTLFVLCVFTKYSYGFYDHQYIAGFVAEITVLNMWKIIKSISRSANRRVYMAVNMMQSNGDQTRIDKWKMVLIKWLDIERKWSETKWCEIDFDLVFKCKFMWCSTIKLWI